MNVLITGADGFIGSHLVECCLEFGYDVKAVVFYNSFNSYGWLDTFSKQQLDRIEVLAGDIRDPHWIRKILKKIDIVFHLAALVGIPFSYHSPEMYLETNIKGTLNILQAARDFNTRKIILTSTSEVYGTAKYVPIDEKHPRKAQSPYSATKIGADCLAESFYRSFNLPVVVARPFNTYGPRQSLRAVIPTIIMQVLNGHREIRLGALHPTRDFNYVRDICKGFLALANAENVLGEEFNIASGIEISIGELAQTIITMLHADAKVILDATRLRPEKSEVERLVGSYEKIKTLTGWQPEYSLENGLGETIEWFTTTRESMNYKTEDYNI